MARILISGANRGIGLEFTRQFKARGDEVLAACRKPSPELEAAGVEILSGIDVSDDGVIPALAAALGDRELDIVVNNAGILERETLDDFNFETIRAQFEVNSLGPMRVVLAVRDKLRAGSKIAMITSRMGSIADNGSGERYGYRMSKCALNMAATSLARDLAPQGIQVAILHPGGVETEMTGDTGNVTAAESASQRSALIDGLDAASSGTFWHANGDILPW